MEYACRAGDEVVDGPYALDTADGAPLIRGWWRASMPVGTWTYWRPDGTPLLTRNLESMDERRWYPTGVLAAHFTAATEEHYFPSGRLSQRREPGARITYRPDGRELITTGCYVGGQASDRPCPDGTGLWRWPATPWVS